RVLVKLGDSVTTDHISPAGSIAKDSPAGHYLIEHGVDAKDFNSYGARRGNHEVMVRGTFANIRLRNELVPGIEGGWTRHLPDGAGRREEELPGAVPHRHARRARLLPPRGHPAVRAAPAALSARRKSWAECRCRHDRRRAIVVP